MTSMGYNMQGGPQGRTQSAAKSRMIKGVKRASKPKRAINDTSGHRQGAHREQPATSFALAARMGYHMEYKPPSAAGYTPDYSAANTSPPLKTSFHLNSAEHGSCFARSLFEHDTSGVGQCAARPFRDNFINASPHPAIPARAGRLPDYCPDDCQIAPGLDGHRSQASTMRQHASMAQPVNCKGLDTAGSLKGLGAGNFTFSASQPVAQPAKTLANLPLYADKRRKQSRESLPHDSPLFVGFSSWLEVSFFTLKARSIAFVLSGAVL